MFGFKARRAKRQNDYHEFGSVAGDNLVRSQQIELEQLRTEVIRLGHSNSLLDRVNTAFATENLRKTAELRKVNLAIARRNRTIERLRKAVAEDTALPPLPEFARTKEGKAIYSHAYQMGRRKGRRDVADAIHLSAQEVSALTSMEDTTLATEHAQEAPEQDYGREHAH